MHESKTIMREEDLHGITQFEELNKIVASDGGIDVEKALLWAQENHKKLESI